MDDSAHHDLEYYEKDLNLKVRFLWKPVVNQSMVDQFKYWNSLSLDKRPNIIIAGSATHSIKQSNASVQALDYYRRNLTIMLPYMDSLNQSTTILWALQDPIRHDLLRKDRQMITNEQIDAYNKAAIEIVHFSITNTVHVWSSARLVAQGFKDVVLKEDNNDGLHISSRALRFSIQILWNLYCNDHMNYNDGTCCSDPEKSTIIQVAVLLIFSLFVGINISISIYNKVFRKRRSAYRSYKWSKLRSKCEDDIELVERSDANANSIANSDEPYEEVQFEAMHSSKERLAEIGEHVLSKKDLLILLSRLGVIMFYFYLCDRTNFFMRQNKYFTRPNFFLPGLSGFQIPNTFLVILISYNYLLFLAVAYVFALGIFFTDESSRNTVLHRDQTNELKGWMQLIILGMLFLCQ